MKLESHGFKLTTPILPSYDIITTAVAPKWGITACGELNANIKLCYAHYS